jgi:NTP pyrophosphatase (non-canonical NTP hydrolase)
MAVAPLRTVKGNVEITMSARGKERPQDFVDRFRSRDDTLNASLVGETLLGPDIIALVSFEYTAHSASRSDVARFVHQASNPGDKGTAETTHTPLLGWRFTSVEESETGGGVVNIPLMQEEHRVWRDHNFPDTAVSTRYGLDVDGLLGMVEEVGELAHAVLKNAQGIRGVDDEKLRRDAADALGDVFVYMVSFASCNGFDLDKIIASTWQQVRSRDWRADPVGAADAKV